MPERPITSSPRIPKAGRSSPTLPVTTGVIRPNFEGKFVDLEQRDIPTLGQLTNRIQDIGVIPSEYDFIGGGAHGAQEAVANVAPHLIADLRKRGKSMIDIISRYGLQQRSLGQRPLSTEAYQRGIRSSVAGESDFAPNVPVPGEATEALEIMQERWPRLFGHNRDITDTDAITKLAAMSKGKISLASSTAEVPSRDPKQKFSRLALAPDAIQRQGGGTTEEFADSIAHEMLHSKDRLRYGEKEFKRMYDEGEKQAGGYDPNPFEVRARDMGQRARMIVKATKEQGRRSVTGKNARVVPRVQKPIASHPVSEANAPELESLANDPVIVEPGSPGWIEAIRKKLLGG